MGYAVSYRFKVDVPALGKDVCVNGSAWCLHGFGKGSRFCYRGMLCEVIESCRTARAPSSFPHILQATDIMDY